MTRHPSVIDVRIKNSENNTFYYFAAREDRLKAFYQFIVADRKTVPGPFIPGISGMALEGSKCLFTSQFNKFPSMDVLAWLRDQQKTYLGEYPNPKIEIPEIENALERFGLVTPQLHQDGSGEEIVVEPASNAE